ncbi:ABC transporter ATP-binding protein [Streptomyces sp. NPDC051976]|uniref:ABC transporter ATP-binding protein n=1 Tax=Streptomyces sp. NPDC051976 TaxID=3154947 RepID=UPI003414627E
MAGSTQVADPQTPEHRAPDLAADRILRDATRHSAGRAVALCLLGLTGIGIALLLPFALGRALDMLLTGRPAGAWVTRCAALIGAQILLGAADDVLGAVTAARATAWLRLRLVRHVLDAGPQAANGASGKATSGAGAGDLVTRLVGNAADAGAVPPAVAALPAALALPVGGIVALGLTDPWLAAAFLAGGPPLALLVRRYARSSSDCVARYLEAQGAIAGRLVEALGGARTIAAARTEERENARVLEPLPELSAQGHRMWRVQGRATAQAAVLVPLLQIVVLAVGGIRLRQGGISLGELLAATRYASMATGIGLVVGQLNGLVRGRAAAHRLAAVLGVPAARYGERSLPPGDGTLELRGVTVLRGGATVLDRLDLTVPGGACVAVVGHSGAGKSVLAALAGRLADPDDGQVLLDGVPLPELRADALRDAVGYAFERPVLLGDTIGDALRFGLREPPPDTVTEAARAAGADGFVHLLPDAYDTPRAAAPMSGGEVQRLGLARAFAHAGRLLVLDDATSSLDTVTELRVTQALSQDPRHRTRLVVAHRASTAARADLVAWLTHGHLRALGPHEDLWQTPEYREVFAAGGDLAAEGSDLHA